MAAAGTTITAISTSTSIITATTDTGRPRRGPRYRYISQLVVKYKGVLMCVVYVNKKINTNLIQINVT